MPTQPPPPRPLPLVSRPVAERAAPDAPASPAPAAPLARGYAVLVTDGAKESVGRSGLSHADAMADAEELQRGGKTARVMHVIGAKSYEVDRYPPR